MKNPLKLYYCAIAWIFLGACTYEPEEVYFKEVDHPEPKADISLNNFDDTDTIRIYRATEFSYHVSISQGIIDRVQVVLDNKELRSTQETSGTFSINNQVLRTGTFELKIQFISSSGTGSLADKIDAENIQVWRKWTLKIDVSPPPKPLLQLSSENGFVKLTWNGYNKPNFVQYTISSTQSGSTKKNIRIEDSSQTFWIDSSYMGGSPVTYRLATQALETSYSDPKTIDDPLSFTVTYNASDSIAILKWKKPRFSGAFKEFVIYENGIERFHIPDIQDTTLSYRPEVVYRSSVGLKLKVVPKYTSNYNNFELYQGITNLVNVKKTTHTPGQLHFNAGINSIIAYSNTSGSQLHIYNSDMQETGSVAIKNGAFSIPYSGTLIYFNDGRKVVQHNLLTQEQKTHTINANIYVSWISSISASSNEIVGYYCYNLANSKWPETTYGVIHNMATGTTIVSDQTNKPRSSFYSDISDNGKYAYRSISYTSSSPSQQLYRINNGSTLEHVGTPARYSFTGFREDDSEEMFISSPAGMTLCNSNDMTVKRTITAPEGYGFYSYDPVTKYALFLKPYSKVQYFINIDTQEMKSIKAFYSGNDMTYKLLNGILFSEDGSYLKVL